MYDIFTIIGRAMVSFQVFPSETFPSEPIQDQSNQMKAPIKKRRRMFTFELIISKDKLWVLKIWQLYIMLITMQ